MKLSTQNLALFSLLMVASTPVSLADLGVGDGQNQEDPIYSQPGPSDPGMPSETENQGMIYREMNQMVDGEMALSLSEALGMDLAGQEIEAIIVRAHGIGSEGVISIRSGEHVDARLVAGWTEDHTFQLGPQADRSDLNATLIELHGRFIVDGIGVRLRGYGRGGGRGDDHGGGECGRDDGRGNHRDSDRADRHHRDGRQRDSRNRSR